MNYGSWQGLRFLQSDGLFNIEGYVTKSINNFKFLVLHQPQDPVPSASVYFCLTSAMLTQSTPLKIPV